jgi:hypothetical protein
MSAGPPRPEYEALARDFRALAAPFDLRVDDAVERDLALVATAFEATDRHVDATPDAVERGELCAAVLRVLREGREDERVTGDLSQALSTLRAHLRRLGAVDGFTGHLARFFVRTETLRLTRSGAEYLRCIVDEARAAAHMTLIAVPAVAIPRFGRFFLVLSEIANLVDKLHDVRGDHARGEIAVRPGIVLHLRLLAAFARRVPVLLSLTPRPLRLVAWGMRYVFPRKAPPGRLPVLDP